MCEEIPPEIWDEEIFPKLPRKSLGICSCVCKFWNTLITHQSFITRHYNTHNPTINNNDPFIIFFQPPIRGRSKGCKKIQFYSLTFHNNNHHHHHWYLMSKLPPIPSSQKMKSVIGTCNGLVCMAGDELITIWNPCIRKYLLLPELTTSHSRFYPFYGFGYDSRTNDFKVVVIIVDYEKDNFDDDHCQVFVYSLASASWKRFDGTIPQFCVPKCCWKRSHACAFLNGALHWVVRRKISDGSNYNSILSFNVSEETFGELMLPPCLQQLPFCKVETVVAAGKNGSTNGRRCCFLRAAHDTQMGPTSGETLPEKKDDINYTLTLQEVISTDGDIYYNIWEMKEYGDVKSWTKDPAIHSRRYIGNKFIDLLETYAMRNTGKDEVLDQSNKDDNENVIQKMDSKKKLMFILGTSRYDHGFVGHYVESLFLMGKEYNALSY